MKLELNRYRQVAGLALGWIILIIAVAVVALYVVKKAADQIDKNPRRIDPDDVALIEELDSRLLVDGATNTMEFDDANHQMQLFVVEHLSMPTTVLFSTNMRDWTFHGTNVNDLPIQDTPVGFYKIIRR